jgi:hypothetical protein
MDPALLVSIILLVLFNIFFVLISYTLAKNASYQKNAHTEKKISENIYNQEPSKVLAFKPFEIKITAKTEPALTPKIQIPSSTLASPIKYIASSRK